MDDDSFANVAAGAPIQDEELSFLSEMNEVSFGTLPFSKDKACKDNSQADDSSPGNDGQTTHTTGMSITSSLIESIASGQIESVAMMSLGQTMEGHNEGTKDITNADFDGADKGERQENPSTRLVHEGNLTYLYHQEDPDNIFGGRTGALAIKVLIDQFPTADQISRLKNEYDISKRLVGKCKAVRDAIYYSTGVEALIGPGSEESHSLYLGWVPGITLREWMRQRRMPSAYKFNRDTSGIDWKRKYYESSLRLAMEITKSLAEIHEIGVTSIGNLSAENIILNENSSVHENVSIYIVGLGSASLLQETSKERSESIRHDLRSLGKVLFELFSGETPCKDTGENRKKKLSSWGDENDEWKGLDGEISHNDICLSFRELASILANASVPSRIAVLILDLIEAYTYNTSESSDAAFLYDQHYQSASCIESELNDMCKDIESTLIETGVGCLHFATGKLYGRKDEKIQFINALERVTTRGKAHEVVLVSGFSGVGKTALVKETFYQPLREKGGYYLHVKFDQFHQGKPFAAIITALTELCDSFVNGDAHLLEDFKRAIQEKIDPMLLGVLIGIIPALCNTVGTEISFNKMNIGGLMAKDQFLFASQQFFKALVEVTSPLVLCLDDLQWADTSSLELVHGIVVNPEIKSILFIECYRSNEISQDHPLTTHLDDIRNLGIEAREIQLDNLEPCDVNQMLADVMNQAQKITYPLADIVYRKTSGNVLLVIEFVKSLWNDGLLRYSHRLKAWRWNIDLINSRNLHSDAANFLSQTISSLPHNTQRVLKKMSCLGCQCEEDILSIIVGDESRGTNFQSTIEIALRKGFVEKVGSTFKFSHDQIQRAAYSLIPSDKKSLWHVEIGQQLLKKCSTAENELCLITDQLNRGISMIKEEEWLLCLVKLNYRSGKKSMSSVSFSSAASYLKAGISILEENKLKDEEELLIKLYVLYAETQYCCGKFDEMEKAQNFIFTHAKCLDAMLPAYSTLIYSIMAQNEMEKAIDVGLSVLSKLGQSFPNNPDTSIILKDFSKVSEMLSEVDFTSLLTKHIVDERFEFIMEVLETLCLCAFYSKQSFLPLFVFRMIELTLSHGICSSTCFCFATYSMLLCGEFENIKEAKKYGELALEFMEYSQAEEKVARVFGALYTFTFAWSKPLILHLEPILDGYHRGMKVGDNTYALAFTSQYCLASFQAGKDLPFIYKSIQDFGNKMEQYKQHGMKKVVLPLEMTVTALMGGESQKPTLINMHESLLKDAIQKQDNHQICKIYFYQMMLAYLFWDYELAAQVAEKNHETYCKRKSGRFEVCLHTFYYGLISLALARKTSEEKWITIFQKCMDRIQKQAEAAPYNVEHKVLLLEAEHAFLCRQDDKAKEKYDSSILLAGKNGFVQDQALAYERAGIYYLENSHDSRASYFLGKAHNAYLEWGAKVKANHICASYPF